jgi:hypothetical protein
MSIPDWLIYTAVLVLMVLNIARSHRRFKVARILSERVEQVGQKDYNLMVRAYEARNNGWRELRMLFEFVWPVFLIGPYIPYANGFIKTLWMLQGLVMTVAYVMLWSTIRQDWGQDHVRYLRHLRWRKQQNFPIFRAP